MVNAKETFTRILKNKANFIRYHRERSISGAILINIEIFVFWCLSGKKSFKKCQKLSKIFKSVQLSYPSMHIHV